MNDSVFANILVVDDEPSNLFLLEGLLTAEGFNVYTALNGALAIQLAKTKKPDLVMLDIMMPEITGIEVLEILIQDPETRDIPVIMVTAKVEAEDVEEALRKGAVEYIKKPINEIEMLARLRTILRLKKQEDQLRNLLKSKEEFINMVSHDVRTPFASIAGFGELLLYDEKLMESLTSNHKEYLKFIIDTANFIFDYFNKLLNWSSLGAKELVLRRENILLHKMVYSAAMIYQSKIADKSINLTLDIPESIIVYADPTYLSQVFHNLLSNAVKYTSDNGSITISATILDEKYSISIADSGVGIKNVTANELFGEAFHKSTKGTRGEKGTGVGLRICKMILDAHGFELSFKSQPNAGTEFLIEINKRAT